MGRLPETAPSWEALRRDLAGGSFAARARGLLTVEFTLLKPNGEEFGRLRPSGTSGAELRSGGALVAAFEASGRRYRMVAEDGGELLTAAPKARSIDDLEIHCGGRTFEARISFLRNLATARRPDGGARNRTVARLSGGLAGRSYEALFDAGDDCALPVAVFLLWHVSTNRRRAYRMAGRAGGGAM